MRDAVLAHRRPLIVFFIALVVLGGLAGERLGKPSAHNHFVHLADGWLDGRMHVDGKPPGWCASKTKRGACVHRFDDYARVFTLERTDGSGKTLRAYPCKTKACLERRRTERIERWYILGEGWQEFSRGEVRKLEDGETWYITFPPGPSVAMLPVVAVLGPDTPDVLLTVLAGALIPALLLVLFDRERGTGDGRGLAHVVAVAAWTLATPALWLAPNGAVWFTAQIFGALFVVLFLLVGWGGRRPALAGLCLGLAVACRPTAALPAALVYAAWWWQGGKKPAVAIRFALVLGLCGLALALHNWARFADPFEFGHRFLEIRWQARIQETGLLSTAYLERNLRCMLTLLPVSDPKLPFRVSIHGTAIWLGAPWLLAVVFARARFCGRLALWGAALLAMVPALLYQNSGQLQYSYRFGLDWLPLVLVAIVFGGGIDRGKGWRRHWPGIVAALVLAGGLFQGWGAYHFERAKGKLFVRKPAGWPFQSELED